MIRYLLPLLLLLSAVPAGAQNAPLDSLSLRIDLKDVTLEQALQQIAGRHRLQLYYAKSALPATPISYQADNKPLPQVLRELLEPHQLGFFYYRDYAIAIAPARTIDTEYAAAYYAALQSLRKPAEETPETTEVSTAFTLGSPDNIPPSGMVRITGRITEAQSKEQVGRIVIQWPDAPTKTLSADGRGFFELSVPAGEHRIRINQLGFEPFEATVKAYGDGELNLVLTPASTVLAEAVIKAKASDANVASAKIGTVTIDPKAIKKLPTLMGEVDVVRSLLLVTGVTSAGDGAAGFNVRGGDIDQNLMLQDETILFNSSHALGFFSTYNADLVQSIDLHKSIMPAQYGGRLASILDVQMRDGDMEKWKIKGGVGPVSGRFSVEGPVIKQKASLIAGGRASYSDYILGLSKRLELQRSSASFYDLNLRYTHRLDAHNTITLSGYTAADEFVYNQTFGFNYKTLGGQAMFRHFWSEKAVSRLSLVGSRYESTQTDFSGPDGGTLASGIQYIKLKEHLTFKPRRSLQIDAGAETILYKVMPGEKKPYGPGSIIEAKTLENERGIEMALFGNMEWKASSKWLIVGGLRINHYRFLGPKTVYEYDPLVSRETIEDTVVYAAGKTIAQYWSPEPRLSARYRIDPYHSIKAGYSRTSQFVNQIFNSDSPTPTSQYQLSTQYIKPFYSHNIALGYFRNTRRNLWEFGSEVFYRNIDQLWDYKDFAKLVTNETLETEIRYGVGKAYGLELSAKTTRPVYNGQIGYTYSRAQRKIEGINKGAWYASNFDKPHILNIVFNYQPSQRHTWTFQFTYSTGRPTTSPLTTYRLNNNIIVPVYAPRNQVRIPDYHRLDISYTIGKGYNKRKTLKTSWNFSVYNVYARKNAFSVFFESNIYQLPEAKRLSILGTIFPAITINIETI